MFSLYRQTTEYKPNLSLLLTAAPILIIFVGCPRLYQTVHSAFRNAVQISTKNNGNILICTLPGNTI